MSRTTVVFAELPCSSAPVLAYSARGSILSFWVINCEKTRKLLHKRWLTDPVRNSAEIHMLVLALYWATLVPAYFSFDTFQGIGNLGNDSSTVAPRCNESQEFRFFGELSFVTARFWKKFLIARSVCVGAGV